MLTRAIFCRTQKMDEGSQNRKLGDAEPWSCHCAHTARPSRPTGGSLPFREGPSSSSRCVEQSVHFGNFSFASTAAKTQQACASSTLPCGMWQLVQRSFDLHCSTGLVCTDCRLHGEKEKEGSLTTYFLWRTHVSFFQSTGHWFQRGTSRWSWMGWKVRSLSRCRELILASAKRVRDIHLRLASPPYEQFVMGDARIILKPNPRSCFLIDLAAVTASPG